MKTQQIKYYFFSLFVFLIGCKTPDSTVSKHRDTAIVVTADITSVQPAINGTPLHSLLRPDEVLLTGEQYTNTVIFILHNSNPDDWYMLVKSGKDTIDLLYNDRVSGLHMGDTITIRWKMQMFEPAGDPEARYIRETLVDFTKKSEGNLSRFLRSNKQKIQAMYEVDITEGYKEELDEMVKFYLANTANNTVKSIFTRPETPLLYTASKSDRDGKEYYAIALGLNGKDKLTNEHHIYIDPAGVCAIFDYDVADDHLTRWVSP